MSCYSCHGMLLLPKIRRKNPVRAPGGRWRSADTQVPGAPQRKVLGAEGLVGGPEPQAPWAQLLDLPRPLLPAQSALVLTGCLVPSLYTSGLFFHFVPRGTTGSVIG